MRARDITINSGTTTLAGTLTTPKGEGPHPLVICIHGSGPLDRNSNTKHQKLNIFNAFAEYLAPRDIACFRYDKRGIGQSTGTYLSAGHTDLVQDALSVARHFKSSPAFSQLFLLGHSEGAIIAPQVARDCRVDGLVLLCPFVTELERLLEQQGAVMQEHIDTAKGVGAWLLRRFMAWQGGVVAVNRKLIRRVRNSTKPVLWKGFRRVEARWIRELLLISPEQILEQIETETLVLVAGNDLQCPPEDGLKAAGIIGDRATHVLIPGLSHMLRMEGDLSGFAGYDEQIRRPMDRKVTETVENWLATRVSGQADQARF